MYILIEKRELYSKVVRFIDEILMIAKMFDSKVSVS